MNTSIETSYGISTCIALGPCSEAFVWARQVDLWSLTWRSSEISPQLLIGEFLKLTRWNVDSSLLCFWVPEFGFCLRKHMVDTNGFLPLYSKSRAYLQVPDFGHSHQWCASSIMSSICSEHGHFIFITAALLDLTFTHPILHFLHRPAYLSWLISQMLHCLM